MRRACAGLIGLLVLNLEACGNSAREAGPKASAGSAGSAGSVADAGETGEGGKSGAPPIESGGQAGSDQEAGHGGDGSGTCEPGARRCDGKALYECDVSGTVERILEFCNTPYTFCIDDSMGGAACLTGVCTPGVAACAGNEVRVCDEHGQYPAQGTSCGEQACFEGECLPRICQPATDSCQDGNIHLCVDNGTATMLQMECPLGTQCFDLGSYAECGLDHCDPDGPACLGNQIGTCDAGGGSLSSVTDDCAADGMVCGLDLACAESVVDTIAEDGTYYADGGGSLILLNLIDVYTDRRVILLDYQLALAQPSELTWLIYEWIDDHYVLRIDDHTEVSAGEGTYASNPLSYDLKAGTRYAIGVYSSSSASFYSGDADNAWLSFARVRGGLIGNGYNYLFPDELDFPSPESQLHITTQLTPP